MCGIAGILRWRADVDESMLGKMLDVIRHRGPDDEGRMHDGPVAMGMRRLSIIDLSSGHQPLYNEDGSIAVVFNGEIYNYVELREELVRRGHRFSTTTDTEVLVHLYEEAGTGLLERLNGMFAFSIWDKNRRRLVVARDRLGVKPLYWASLPDGLIWASELKSILVGGLLDRRTIDAQAILDYFAFQYVPGERTPFREIRKLLPGHLLVADADGTRVERWWRLADHVRARPISRPEARERVRSLFMDAVKLRMRSDVPVGAFLSGGLDSSLVVVAAARQTSLPFATFSVGFAGSEFDELPYARKVAEWAHTDHREIRVTPADALEHLPNLVWHLDEPNGDSAVLPSFLVAQLAAKHVKVALSGLGGDELFGGYPRYHRRLGKFDRLGLLPRPVLRVLRPLLGPLKEQWRDKLDRMITPLPPWREYVERVRYFDEATARSFLSPDAGGYGTRLAPIFDEYPGDDYVNQRLFVDAHSYLPDQILPLTDRTSMAVSLEVRNPFLDVRLVELLSGLPGSWKVSGSSWKILLKEATGDLVPPAILARPKWGFASPVRTWARTRGLEGLVRLLRDSRLTRAGVIERRALDALLARPDLASKAEWLWILAILEIWFRLYGDGPLVAPASLTLKDLVA